MVIKSILNVYGYENMRSDKPHDNVGLHDDQLMLTSNTVMYKT
jgi:hypothetical protein